MRFLFDKNTWQEIFGSIGKNKTRTIITVIGVLWGIFIYIVLAGASQGMDNGFEKNFETVAFGLGPKLQVCPMLVLKPDEVCV